jgi:cyanophycin synthetase
LVAWLVHLNGRHVGLACRDGLFLDRRRVEAGDCAQWEPAHRLLINRTVQAAVIENGAGAILSDGLAYDRCDVGIVTDMDGWESLAAHDIHEPDQMTRVLRTQVDVVLPHGVAVLNADDARVVALADLCDGDVILYASDAAALADHRERGGRAVFMRDSQVVLATGSSEVLVGNLRRGRGRSDPQQMAAQNRVQLAAMAAAWAMGISLDLMSAGIETFDWDLRQFRERGH